MRHTPIESQTFFNCNECEYQVNNKNLITKHRKERILHMNCKPSLTAMTVSIKCALTRHKKMKYTPIELQTIFTAMSMNIKQTIKKC